MTRYSDDELLAALRFARSDDRALLIGALGEAVEVAGSGASDELVRIFRTEKGHSRTAALHALGQRLGEAATAYGIDALHSTSWALQTTGAELLADHGAALARDEFFAWFERKLRAKDRRELNWGRYDMLDIVPLRRALRAPPGRGPSPFGPLGTASRR